MVQLLLLCPARSGVLYGAFAGHKEIAVASSRQAHSLSMTGGRCRTLCANRYFLYICTEPLCSYGVRTLSTARQRTTLVRRLGIYAKSATAAGWEGRRSGQAKTLSFLFEFSSLIQSSLAFPLFIPFSDPVAFVLAPPSPRSRFASSISITNSGGRILLASGISEIRSIANHWRPSASK